MPTLQDLSQLQKRRDLAQLMAFNQHGNSTPLAGGISALANVLAARKANNLGGQIETMRSDIQKADSAALAQVLQGGDPSLIANIQNPETRNLAMVMLNRQGADARHKESIEREDRFRAEDAAAATAEIEREDAQRADDRANEIADREDAQAHQIALEGARRAREQSKPGYIEQQTIQANRKRLETLQEGRTNREASKAKAEDFLAAFKEGQSQGHLEGLDLSGGADSGAGRSAMSFLPTFTDQGRFDEMLDAFAEEAARAKLKAAGETRPTDADVEGMKRSLFGIGKDEKTNIALLESFIEEQSANDDEFSELQRQFGLNEESEGDFVEDLPDATGMAEGTRAVDESTGEMHIVINGQWVKQR